MLEVEGANQHGLMHHVARRNLQENIGDDGTSFLPDSRKSRGPAGYFISHDS